MENIIIKTENLGFTYEDAAEESPLVKEREIPALDGVSLEIKEGEYIAVLGHNGSGKSTFAKLLNLILTPTVGKIYVDGVDITDENFSEDDVFNVRGKIGMVFQNPDNQLVATVVEEDVAFGPENLGLPREEIRKRVDEALSVVGMTEYARHAPHKLSGGQKQRVAIAGIIAMKPKVIIFDESTAMLDPKG
ncbi:MAG: ATP-binding cassette domain-containing protein, partial [Clostridia bacterium]|nr:ATP-binding cassette domain-containing protein [Clostridia bacterium]